ncbi:MAG TPA: hypothetical protein VFE47_25515 [Tepidisphaeraceae bacterium]|jgi:hypothetical protein|nr:hypothetical protein [Tepidisphaeraceae bacterium]
MERDKSTIILQGGLGLLPFGASEGDVELYLGAPEYKDSDSFEWPSNSGNWFHVSKWVYGDDVETAGLVATFTTVAGRGHCLTGFQASTKDFVLFGERLIGLHENDATSHLELHGISRFSWIEHGCDEFGDSTCFCSHGLSFESRDFRIASLMWNIEGKRDEPINWTVADEIRAQKLIAAWSGMGPKLPLCATFQDFIALAIETNGYLRLPKLRRQAR